MIHCRGSTNNAPRKKRANTMPTCLEKKSSIDQQCAETRCEGRTGLPTQIARNLGGAPKIRSFVTRHTGPLTMMPSADQVPIKSSHFTMLRPKGVVEWIGE